jgi:nucleoid-associated protein YgaU
MRGLALLASGLMLLVGVLRWVAEATFGALGDAAAPGPARLEDVAGGLAGLAAGALLLWLAVAVVTSVLVTLVPRAAPEVSPWGRLIAPTVVRHLVAALVGAAIIGAATPASADTGVGGGGVPVACAGRSPVASAAVSVSVHGDGSDAVVSPDWRPTSPGISPGWLPTRPIAWPPVRAGADPAIVSSSRRRPTMTVDDEIVVRRGDNLWTLTERYLGPGATDGQIAVVWRRWFAANRSVLTAGPDHLVPGMRLRPPDLLAATGTESRVADGPGGAR